MKKIKHFKRFANEVVSTHYNAPGTLFMEATSDEQTDLIVEALNRLDGFSPLTLVDETETTLVDGLKPLPVRYASTTDVYVLLSDVVRQLRWFQPRAHAWAEIEYGRALADQRRRDEERGDGCLGWDLIRGYIDLGLYLSVDDPDAHPDADGQHWSESGDWLISTDKLPWLLTCWRNSRPAEVDDFNEIATGFTSSNIWRGAVHEASAEFHRERPGGGDVSLIGHRAWKKLTPVEQAEALPDLFSAYIVLLHEREQAEQLSRFEATHETCLTGEEEYELHTALGEVRPITDDTVVKVSAVDLSNVMDELGLLRTRLAKAKSD